MEPISAYKRSWLIGLFIGLPLICIASIVFLFARMYQQDMRSLGNFVASYQTYDRAIVAASASVFDANVKSTAEASTEERQADVALSDLKNKSSVRISSLIKNEQEAMLVMQEIADLSDKEVSTLKAYSQAAGQDANRSSLAQAFHDLTEERHAAFTRFEALGR